MDPSSKPSDIQMGSRRFRRRGDFSPVVEQGAYHRDVDEHAHVRHGHDPRVLRGLSLPRPADVPATSETLTG